MISILKVNEGKEQLMKKVLEIYVCISLSSEYLREVESVIGHIIFLFHILIIYEYILFVKHS